MRKRGLVAGLVGLLVVVAGAVAWWWPFLDTGREYAAAMPQAVPLYTAPIVELFPRQDVCFEPAIVDRRSERAYFRVATFHRRRGVPLKLTITGRGYAFEAHVPGSYGDNALVTVPVTPPREDTLTRICLTNVGTRRIALHGVDDRTRAALNVTRAGVTIPTAVEFAFYESRPVSIAERLSTIFHRMEVFRPGFLGPWLFWPLTVLCALGLPLGALWALSAAVSSSTPERDAPRDR